MLSASRADFAILPGDPAVIARIDPADFVAPGGKVLLDFHADAGASPIRITPTSGGQILSRQTGPRRSRTLAELGIGTFSVAAGGAPIRVSLAGDVNGDFRVDANDLQRIAGLNRVQFGGRRYDAGADLNRNGVIGTGDLLLARRNLGAATRVRPLSATLGLAPGTPRDAQGRVTSADVTLVGLSHPGAGVGLDLGADGSINRTTTADASGSYRFAISPGVGTATLAAVTTDRFGQRATARLSFERVQPGGPTTPIDVTVPSVTITAPAPGRPINVNPAITGTAIDDRPGLVTLTAQVDGGATLTPVTPSASGAFTFTPRLAVDGSADGSHSVAFVARDAAGNTTRTAFAFTLDTRAPTASTTITGVIRTAPSSFDVRFSEPLSGAANPAAYVLARDGQAVAIASVTLLDATTARLTFASPLADGGYALSIAPTVADAAGNALSGPTGFVFTVAMPTVVTEVSPANGEEMVSLTRETIVRFDDAVDPATVTADSLYLIAKGERIPGTIRVSRTERFATFFYAAPLPESTEVRVVVDGSKIVGRDGIPIDADGDSEPGGLATADFRTLPLTLIPGTAITGRVLDSYRRAPDGSDLPVVGATIFLDARTDIRAVTDANGNFTLTSPGGLPAPEFFVHIDGSTATNAPDGTVYATLGKPFHTVPGQSTPLSMDGKAFSIYLPPMAMGEGNIVMLPPGEDTVVGFGTFAQQAIRDLFPGDAAKAQAIIDTLRVTYPAGSARDQDGNPATMATVIPVDPRRLPAPLPPNVSPQLVISVQAGTAAGFNLAGGSTNFDVPAPVTFPNLEGMMPGEKALIWSFDHDAGRWKVIGTGTVTSDGKAITSDPGVGIEAPGWHFVIRGTILDVPLARSNFYVCGTADDFTYADNPSVSFPLNLLVGATALFPASVLEANVGLYVRGLGGATGGQLMDNFVAGTGTALPFPDGSELSNAIRASDTFTGLKDRIASAIEADIQSQANGGSIDNRRIFLPPALASNRSYYWDSAFLLATIGSIQGTEVSIRDFSASGTIISPEVGGTGSYSGTLHFKMCDDFGVGLDDISGLKAGSALLDMWVLQHIKSDGSNYRPFVVSIELDVPINGNFLIPAGFEDIQIDNSSRRTRAAASSDPVSAAVGFGADPVVHYRLALNTVEIVGSGSPDRVFDQVVLPVDQFFTLAAYQPSTNRSLSVSGVSGPSGLLTSASNILGSVGRLYLTDFGGLDRDGDQVPDIGEYVIGSDSLASDSDGDGVSDSAELAQGLNPLDGVAFPTGVIASLTLPGPAEAIDVAGDLAYVATGSHGLAIIDGARFDQPILFGQIDLPGTATGVGVAPELSRAVVATGATLELVDVSDPMNPRVDRSLPIAAEHVVVAGGFAYAASVTTVRVVDLISGEVVRNVTLPGSGNITGMAREGSYLYAYISGSDLLSIVDITRPEQAAVVGQISVGIASSDVGVFAGDGVVWLSGSGLRTVNVGDPTRPTLISDADNFFTARRFALNGSGLGLLLPDGGNFVQVYDTANTGNTNTLLTQFNLPAAGRSVAISRGIGYVGTASGLAVVNYRPFDNKGVAPTVNVSTPVADLDPSVDGVQVVQGGAVPIKVVVRDDVQVRIVELLVDGKVVASDVSFPYDFSAVALSGTAGATSISVQARATDTGGNSTLSAPLVLQLVPDTFAPTIAAIDPADGGLRGQGTRTVRVRLSESIDPTRLTTETFALVEAGPDGKFGGADDVAVPIRQRDLLNADRLVQLTTDPLVPGLYQVRIAAAEVADGFGNALGTGTVTSGFEVKDFIPVTINFNAGSGSPVSYTESGLTVTSGQAHVHFESGLGLGNHSGCCSTPYTFSLGGATFSVLSFDVAAGSAIGQGTFTSSTGASATPTALGTFTLDPAGWTNLTSFGWDQPDGDMVIDNLVLATLGDGGLRIASRRGLDAVDAALESIDDDPELD